MFDNDRSARARGLRLLTPVFVLMITGSAVLVTCQLFFPQHSKLGLGIWMGMQLFSGLLLLRARMLVKRWNRWKAAAPAEICDWCGYDLSRSQPLRFGAPFFRCAECGDLHCKTTFDPSQVRFGSQTEGARANRARIAGIWLGRLFTSYRWLERGVVVVISILMLRKTLGIVDAALFTFGIGLLGVLFKVYLLEKLRSAKRRYVQLCMAEAAKQPMIL